MKTTTLLLLCFGVSLSLRGSEDTPYQAALLKLEERYSALETKRTHLGNPAKALPAAEEKERQYLLGNLAATHPLWVLIEQLHADIRALTAEQSVLDARDAALLDELKTFLALTSGMQGKARSLDEARSQASQLRRFIVRRDLEGMKKWTASFP